MGQTLYELERHLHAEPALRDALQPHPACRLAPSSFPATPNFSPSCHQDDILSFEPDKQAVYQQVYRPVYFQLVDVLLHKAQFPSDEEYGFWSSDEKEQFRIYRCGCSQGLSLPGWQEQGTDVALGANGTCWVGRRGCWQHPASQSCGETRGRTQRRSLLPGAVLAGVVAWRQAGVWTSLDTCGSVVVTLPGSRRGSSTSVQCSAGDGAALGDLFVSLQGGHLRHTDVRVRDAGC